MKFFPSRFTATWRWRTSIMSATRSWNFSARNDHPEANSLNTYESSILCCYNVVRPRAQVSRSGLELSRDPRFGRDADILDALYCPMVGVRAAGRKRDSGFVLVLEYRREHHHVCLFSFPARSGRRHRVSSELDHLHSQSDADS